MSLKISVLSIILVLITFFDYSEGKKNIFKTTTNYNTNRIFKFESPSFLCCTLVAKNTNLNERMKTFFYLCKVKNHEWSRIFAN